ncbi:MAG: glycosyltransferase family 61 protein [Verrucomicrobiota bacterium]
MGLIVKLRTRLRRYRKLALAWNKFHTTLRKYWLQSFAMRALRKVSPVNSRFGPVKGVFSAYEELRQGRLRGRILLHEQPTPPAAPDSLRKRCRFDKKQDECQPWPIFWSYHPEARLVTQTLALQDNQKRLCLEAVFRDHLPYDPAYQYLVLPKPVRLKGNWTSVVSRWQDGFGHWFFDVVPRLALLAEFPPDTQILAPPELPGYQWETLRWLGLAERVRPTPERHLILEHYYFSPPTILTGCYNPYGVFFLRRSFLCRAARDYEPPRRFFVRRVGKTRGMLNEDEVAAYLERAGWAIVNPEGMPMEKQIKLFAEAEAVCAAHGAALTHLVWARPGCRVYEICVDNYLNGCFEGLAEAVGSHYRFMVCPGDRENQFHVSLAELEKLLLPEDRPTR